MMADKRKNIVSQILGDPEAKEGAPEGESLDACVSELIDAVHAKDVEGAKSALRACFAELESEPHEEGPHIGE